MHLDCPDCRVRGKRGLLRLPPPILLAASSTPRLPLLISDPGQVPGTSANGSKTFQSAGATKFLEELIASPLNVRHSLEDCLEDPLVGGRKGKTRLEARIADRKAFARRDKSG